MVNLLRENDVKTRVPHQCWGCDIVYPRGTTMLSQTAVGDTGVYTGWLCDICHEVIRECRYDADDLKNCRDGDIRDGDRDVWREVAISLGKLDEVLQLEAQAKL